MSPEGVQLDPQEQALLDKFPIPEHALGLVETMHLPPEDALIVAKMSYLHDDPFNDGFRTVDDERFPFVPAQIGFVLDLISSRDAQLWNSSLQLHRPAIGGAKFEYSLAHIHELTKNRVLARMSLEFGFNGLPSSLSGNLGRLIHLVNVADFTNPSIFLRCHQQWSAFQVTVSDVVNSETAYKKVRDFYREVGFSDNWYAWEAVARKVLQDKFDQLEAESFELIDDESSIPYDPSDCMGAVTDIY